MLGKRDGKRGSQQQPKETALHGNKVCNSITSEKKSLKNLKAVTGRESKTCPGQFFKITPINV